MHSLNRPTLVRVNEPLGIEESILGKLNLFVYSRWLKSDFEVLLKVA